MFGSSKDSKDNSSTASASRSGAAPSRGLNTVNEGTTLTGDLDAASDIRIDGTINGDLRCKSKVIIGPKGKIKGTVVCESAVIEGHFDGKLQVHDSLTIKETAHITGEVVTKNIAMSAGCQFDGTLSTKTNKAGGKPVDNSGSDKIANLKQKERAGA